MAYVDFKYAHSCFFFFLFSFYCLQLYRHVALRISSEFFYLVFTGVTVANYSRFYIAFFFNPLSCGFVIGVTFTEKKKKKTKKAEDFQVKKMFFTDVFSDFFADTNFLIKSFCF